MTTIILNRLNQTMKALVDSLHARLRSLGVARVPSLVPIAGQKRPAQRRRRMGNAGSIAIAMLGALFLAGCQSPKGMDNAGFGQATAAQPEVLTLREGDTIKITFPGSPNLNTVQQIRRDGKISLPMVGEFKAVGLAPSDLEKELVKLYAPQLVTKEVNVSLDSSAFFVFITGAVARPGRIAFDRPITALEAVIDAGVDYAKANLKNVTVIRRKAGQENQFHLNLKDELRGGGSEPFYLQPSDIVFVRERFTWF